MTETKKRNTVQGHRITWWVYAGGNGAPLEKLRHTSRMRGGWPGWDASCECGWESRTGGAVRSYVEREVRFHKWANGGSL